MGIALNYISESERERIAKSLFEVKRQDNEKGELQGLCPLHEDRNPSFGYNYKSDAYYCFACLAAGDLARLWYKTHGYSDEIEGFRAFCREFEIDQGSRRDRSISANLQSHPNETEPLMDLESVWERFPPLPEARIRELEISRGWNKRTIEKIDLRLQTYYLDAKSGLLKKISNPDRIAIPVRDKKGQLVNIRLYRPGATQNKIMSWAKSTGKARLFPTAPLYPNEILLCEGEPDTICALSNGLNAITQTIKTKSWSKEHLDPFKGRDVVIAYDADQAGQNFMVMATKSLKEVAKSVRVLDWPEWMGKREDGTWPKDHGEDLTDYFVKHKKRPGDLLELMATARFYTDEDDSSPEYLKYYERVNDRLSFRPKLLGDRISKQLDLLWDPSMGLFYKWNGRIWKIFHEEHIGKLCSDCLGIAYTKGRVDDTINYIKLYSAIPDGRQLNDRKDHICILNGLLDLKTVDLKPHNKDFLCTFMLPVEYNPESKECCDRFLQYLDETIQTPEVIAQLQEFAGYCLTPSTEFEKCLLLLGPGADGKSTFLKILRELVGPENCSSVSFADLEDQFQRSALYSKLLNISTEVGSKAIESPYFKAITSGDPISAAFKFKNIFSFHPTSKLAFAANHLPRVRDNSDGFYRRVLPIKFKRQFLDDADPSLFEKLKSEISEIFHWSIMGLHRLWEQKGFTQSCETKNLLLDYRRENNPVLAFVEDRCIIDDKKEIGKDELYVDYRNYCGESGYKIMSKQTFFREIYNSVHTLNTYRPQVDGRREYIVRGIAIAKDN
jgi:putative DNA primase/helicase